MPFNLWWTPFYTPPPTIALLGNVNAAPPGSEDLGSVTVFDYAVLTSTYIGQPAIRNAMDWATYFGHPTAVRARYRTPGLITFPGGGDVQLAQSGAGINNVDLTTPEDGTIGIGRWAEPFLSFDPQTYTGRTYTGLLSFMPTERLVLGDFGTPTEVSANVQRLLAPMNQHWYLVTDLHLNTNPAFLLRMRASGWVYQEPDVQFLMPIGTPPLIQRQRSDGLGGGGPEHSTVNTRQGGLYQAGIY